MFEIENFLHKNICNYLIDFYKYNTKLSEAFEKRRRIDLLKINDDLNITSIVNLYKRIKPLDSLINIELVYWPIGEKHDWHDDTVYYDYTSITYLNENYIGGRTELENYSIVPKIGKIVLFESKKLHRVTCLEKNDRYVIAAWYKYG
tara:strand:- start:186 stop:626 length:441 start_codon:yes stop_codon:yes gene_type:complete